MENDVTKTRKVLTQPPETYGECKSMPRPCPYVRCRYHLASSKKKRPDERKLDDMEETCALDVAEKEGGCDRVYVGRLLNMTPERVRQLEVHAMQRLQRFGMPDYGEEVRPSIKCLIANDDGIKMGA